MTPEGEQVLEIDKIDDPMWERLLSVDPHVTPESLTRILEMEVDTAMFDEAQCKARKIDGRKEASSPAETDRKYDMACCFRDLI